MIFGGLLILPSGFLEIRGLSLSLSLCRSLNFCSSESLEIQNGLQEVKRFGGGGCFGLEVNLVCTVGEYHKNSILRGKQSEPLIFWRKNSNISFSITS